MTPKEAAKVVGYLLETNGTTGSYGRDSSGKRVHPLSPEACRWCLVGAINVVNQACRVYNEALRNEISKIVPSTNPYIMIDRWEGPDSSDATRAEIVQLLKELQ